MEVLAQLSPSAVLLTPNRRLSAFLLKKYHEIQYTSGKRTWTTAAIMPMESWVEKCWNDHLAQQMTVQPLLLNDMQEQCLWEDIVKKTANVLQVANTAKLGRQAYKTLRHWRIDLSHPELVTTEDGVAFQQWAMQFVAACKKRHCLAKDDLIETLIPFIQQNKIIPPAELWLYGFTEHTPLELALIETCKLHGTKIKRLSAPEFASHHWHRIALTETEVEIETMARWAKQRYEQNPHERIGCVFLQLEQIREPVLRIFSAVFAEAQTIELDHTVLPFNISAGKSLAAYPIIHIALLILQWKVQKVPLSQLSEVLRSPFLGEAESERIQRAVFENTLRSSNKAFVNLKQLTKNNDCPAFLQRIQAYLRKQSTIVKQRHSMGQWSHLFVELLDLLGWPGERTLDTTEYQVVKDWYDLLQTMATLDRVLPVQSYATAVDYLMELTVREIFQPESPERQIQLLGLLEAADVPFDALWVMGMDDTVWPPYPKPNPFIPQRLQKKYNMPHATAERELAYCERLTEQLKNGAREVWFSHSLKNEESDLRPSPFISALPEQSLTALALSDFQPAAFRVYANRALEYHIDDQAMPVSRPDRLRGGANILKWQAACPFKAFAEIRLHARHIDSPTLGLRATERGNLLHRALEKIWEKLQNQEALLTISITDLQIVVETSLRESMNTLAIDVKQQARYLELEFIRFRRILLEWLEQEKARPPFQIAALEKEVKTTFCQMPISLRIDRIDTLANGKKVLIDYKSSKTLSIASWFGERPDEPQLPFYCIVDPSQTIGIMFAQIHPENMAFKGVAAENLDIESVKPLAELQAHTDATDWNEQIASWQKTLEQLGTQFFTGVAKVDPKEPATTCEFCHLQPLCRINEVITPPEVDLP